MVLLYLQGQSMAHLRAQEAAARLGWSTSTLYNRIKKGDFPSGVKFGPRLVVWPEEVVDTWLAQKKKAQLEQLARILAASSSK